MVKAVSIEQSKINWKPAWRIISTKFVSQNLFDDIAPIEDFDALNQLDEMANQDRAKDRSRMTGEFFIDAPFYYRWPGRFNDESFGALYAAKSYFIAIAETKYHREQFMAYTHERPQMLELRVLNMTIAGDFHDVRSIGYKARMYNKDNYHASQQLGRELRKNDSNGIVYNSVRHEKGECVAVFNPSLVKNCKHLKFIGYYWDGSKILYHSDDINVF